MKRIRILVLLLAVGSAVYGREYHVSVKGDDANQGTETSPFRSIGRAAQAAYAGDVITVHAGTYREWVNPPRGGTGDDARIVYRAAPGEHVEIKGSEIVNTWTKEADGVWKAVLPNSFFGDYNPYVDLIYGDWFGGHGRAHHTGEVFLNGKSLYEKETLDKVRKPEIHSGSNDPESSKYVWYCESDAENTVIHANFHQYNPNREQVEISVRRTCFYPEKPGVNYLTVQGFHISQAASQWAAPTAEQIGMVATHWNKGWIIENNVISNAKCSGITLGKERGTGHNVWLEDRSIDGSLHYIEVTFRTLRNGWNSENIGSHIVRNNEIFSCEQTGICGSMGAAFSIVENNYIHDIWEKRQFSGAEIAGIKFHAAIDTQIRNNRIRRTGRGMWLDWMAQGTRISHNIIYENDQEDLFFEVDHGPYLVDNNILGSPVNVWDMSQGGAYVHNLFSGMFRITQEKGRYTPYHLPHRTDVAGLSIILNGDNRFYNNLFVPVNPDAKLNHGKSAYDKGSYPNFMDGNAYYNRATPFGEEKHSVSQP
ncbi:MAG: right-handed parallel beta-helix repeat-containing protein, partial [Prevotellaceae bacterium]|nr:right-handed parallel beta-helix repeat-containing protein [Prevotellaceae bacterium]